MTETDTLRIELAAKNQVIEELKNLSCSKIVAGLEGEKKMVRDLSAALEDCIAALNYREQRDNEQLVARGHKPYPPSLTLSHARLFLAKAKALT